MELTPKQKFEALKLRYEDQIQLLRFLTQVDWKIFVSIFTLQLGLGAWIAKNPIEKELMRHSIAAIDLALSTLSVKLLYNQHKRRQEVSDTIKNINEALGFNEPGAYLSDIALNPSYKRRYWFKWYTLGVIVATIGVMVILYSK
jgi:hypothetical protein